VEKRADSFWADFVKRPAMYRGDETGWTLYCFLAGMYRGGDWLELPEMPRLRAVVDRIGSRSAGAYGSGFAAYRLYEAKSLLEWCGFASTECTG
jgi:hypothetical protein